jgi:hypothetical protein
MCEDAARVWKVLRGAKALEIERGIADLFAPSHDQALTIDRRFSF